MIIRNYTPFVPLYFESRDVRGRDFGVMVLRGTFDIIPGAPLRPSPKQAPIVQADLWHGEPNVSSVYMESDLAPLKPRTDILIDAIAHAPSGVPLPDWIVQVKIGELEKALRVTGPRRWVREDEGWRLTEPEPATEVAICYEKAFGGVWEDGWREKEVFEENPVGVGFVGNADPSYPDEIPAPQIEALHDPIIEFGKVYKPQGLGPIGRAWLPRRKLAGAYDDAWKTTRWPELPLDFDFGFYNGAHPDMIHAGYLDGSEKVSASMLDPRGTHEFYLPGMSIAMHVEQIPGIRGTLFPRLDTLFIDYTRGAAHLTWRAQIVPRVAIRSIECHLTSRS